MFMLVVPPSVLAAAPPLAADVPAQIGLAHAIVLAVIGAVLFIITRTVVRFNSEVIDVAGDWIRDRLGIGARAD